MQSMYVGAGAAAVRHAPRHRSAPGHRTMVPHTRHQASTSHWCSRTGLRTPAPRHTSRRSSHRSPHHLRCLVDAQHTQAIVWSGVAGHATIARAHFARTVVDTVGARGLRAVAVLAHALHAVTGGEAPIAHAAHVTHVAAAVHPSLCAAMMGESMSKVSQTALPRKTCSRYAPRPGSEHRRRKSAARSGRRYTRGWSTRWLRSTPVPLCSPSSGQQTTP